MAMFVHIRQRVREQPDTGYRKWLTAWLWEVFGGVVWIWLLLGLCGGKDIVRLRNVK